MHFLAKSVFDVEQHLIVSTSMTSITGHNVFVLAVHRVALT